MAGGRRNITQNFLGLQNTTVKVLKAETTRENEPPTPPAEFCPKTLIFVHFWAMKAFWGGRERPEARRRTHKNF